MTDPEDYKDYDDCGNGKAIGIALGAILTLVAIMLIAMMAYLLSGCTTTKYIPVESTAVRTDTLHHYTHSRDSVWQHDSVYVAMQGDTVRIEKWRTRYQYKYITDTLWRNGTDSVRAQVPYPVERDLTRWEQTKMDFGGMAIGATLLAVVIAVMWLIRKFRK